MVGRVPETISPRRLARNRARIIGFVSAERMTRLEQACENGVADVEVRLEFGTEDRIASVRGHVSADVRLECQRCRKPMSLRIEAQVALAVVEPGDEATHAAAAAAGLEVLEVDDDRVSLTDIVEDELLLALPDYPMHEHGARGSDAVPCSIEDMYTTQVGGEHDAKRAGLISPFAQLSSMFTASGPTTDETT